MKDLSYSQSPGPSSELVDCLEAKCRSLEQFLMMTESLRDRLMSHDLSEVESFLNQRQGLIRTIDQLDERIRQMRLGQPLGGSPGGEKKKVSGLLNRIREVSERARIVDQDCTDRMAGWRDQVRGDFSKMRDSLKAVQGYVRKPMRSPKFLDVTR